MYRYTFLQYRYIYLLNLMYRYIIIKYRYIFVQIRTVKCYPMYRYHKFHVSVHPIRNPTMYRYILTKYRYIKKNCSYSEFFFSHVSVHLLQVPVHFPEFEKFTHHVSIHLFNVPVHRIAV